MGGMWTMSRYVAEGSWCYYDLPVGIDGRVK